MKAVNFYFRMQYFWISEIARRGSHVRVRGRYGRETTVPLIGANIPAGTIRAIESDLCLDLSRRGS